MRVPLVGSMALTLTLAGAPAAWSQGGGASSTGTIQGRVTDGQGAVLWNLKATASYDAAHGIRLSPVLRHQSGSNYARTLSISAPAGLIATGTAYAEPMNANREDDIWVFDVRAEKSVSVADRARARVFFDLFNLTNSHASETISRATGLGYQKPSAILAPRTARLGLRFLW